MSCEITGFMSNFLSFALLDTMFQVGMQNSSLGVVLATTHFATSMVALPPAISAVIMNIMGSSLGFIWSHIQPSGLESNAEAVEKGE